MLNPTEKAILSDLANLAAVRAAESASRAANLAPVTQRASIFLHAAYHLTQVAAGMYATEQLLRSGSTHQITSPEDPYLVHVLRGIAQAWMHAPDTAAMDGALAEALQAFPVNLGEG